MLAAGLALSACGAGVDLIEALPSRSHGWAPERFDGINGLYADLNSDGNFDLVAIGGKESEHVKIVAYVPATETRPEAKFTFDAAGIRAFPGQEFRAEVTKMIAKSRGERADGLSATVQALIADITGLAVRLASPQSTAGRVVRALDALPGDPPPASGSALPAPAAPSD